MNKPSTTTTKLNIVINLTLDEELELMEFLNRKYIKSNPTIEEVKKEWEELEYDWKEDNFCIQLVKNYKQIIIKKNSKTYKCDNRYDVDNGSLYITFQEHQLLTKTLRALPDCEV